MNDRAARKHHQFGSGHHNAKLTEATVVEMRRLHADDGATPTMLAHKFGVSVAVACKVIKREGWKHVP